MQRARGRYVIYRRFFARPAHRDAHPRFPGELCEFRVNRRAAFSVRSARTYPISPDVEQLPSLPRAETPPSFREPGVRRVSFWELVSRYAADELRTYKEAEKRVGRIACTRDSPGNGRGGTNVQYTGIMTETSNRGRGAICFSRVRR